VTWNVADPRLDAPAMIAGVGADHLHVQARDAGVARDPPPGGSGHGQRIDAVGHNGEAKS